MTRQIVLLRGINLGSRNRIAMPELREALAGAGFEDVQTYLQSGNVVLSSDASPEQVAREAERQIAKRFGLDIAVVVRTRDELRAIEARRIPRETLTFAWEGPLKRGAGHYYRIQGRGLLIEYDNTQNDANHVHSVWRRPGIDFGEDILARHYATADHG